MPQQYLNYFIPLKGGAQVNDTEKNLALLQQGQQALAKNLPEMMKNFKGVSEAVLQDGVLSKKEKELIAVAVGVAIHCELWIANHVKLALDGGATVEEILDACSVTVMMGGGPSVAATSHVIKTLKDLGVEV